MSGYRFGARHPAASASSIEQNHGSCPNPCSFSRTKSPFITITFPAAADPETGFRTFLDGPLFDRDHLAFHLGKLAAVCLSPPTKKAAGQKITTAAAVARPSLGALMVLST